ncbi:hypothetical protein AVEN_159507-1 [Araneus ventricosus]|uniref:Uncharacterized protein n=1 Tax=Araneus ventricosus TaxID=182803 RepID=A0A4Y2A142_ARAVE|nr:hypothetical protein AVEN_159507-1 [Araneus ventricosus]
MLIDWDRQDCERLWNLSLEFYPNGRRRAVLSSGVLIDWNDFGVLSAVRAGKPLFCCSRLYKGKELKLIPDTCFTLTDFSELSDVASNDSFMLCSMMMSLSEVLLSVSDSEELKTLGFFGGVAVLVSRIVLGGEDPLRSPRSLAVTFFPTPWVTGQSRCLSGKSSLKRRQRELDLSLAPSVCSLVDVMKRVNYLEPEKPLATKGQAQKRLGDNKGPLRWTPLTKVTWICGEVFSGPFPQEEDEGVKRRCEGREDGDFWKAS